MKNLLLETAGMWNNVATRRLCRRLIAGSLGFCLLASSLAVGVEVNPVLLGTWSSLGHGTLRDVAVSGGYAVVAAGDAGEGGLHAIDVSDPAQPRWRGGISTSDFARRVTVAEGHAYVVVGNAGLEVFAISDPANLRKVGGYRTIGPATDVALFGHHAFLATGSGIEIVDVANPSEPRQVATVTNVFASAIIASGNHLFAAGRVFGNSSGLLGVIVLDISDPTNPQPVGAWEISDSFRRMTGLSLSGRYLYIAGWAFNDDISEPGCGRDTGYYDGLVLLNVSDPTHPERVGGVHCGFYGNEPPALVRGRHAFVGDAVVDVSDPAHPRRIGSIAVTIQNPEWEPGPLVPHGLVISQNRIFVAGNTGLAILEMPPYVKAITKADSNVKVDWEGFGPARLQRATRLTNPDWQDQIGSENTNSITLPMLSGSGFFRLVRP